MSTHLTAAHSPVLLNEVIEALNIHPKGIYIDGTFGRGGHSRAILNQLDADGRLLMVDRDPEAIEAAKAAYQDDARCLIWRGAFAEVANKVVQEGWSGRVNGILLDLGVSSPQLDQARRGFSFMQEGPLDMRMDPDQGMSAQEWLMSVSETDLLRVLREYGEEKQAGRIARRIIAHRAVAPLVTTHDLANLVASVVKGPRLRKHPATRTFQAVRIAVNDELGQLRQFLDQVIDLLAPHGRLAVISFHSLEDRMVKRFMRGHSEVSMDLPPGIPMLANELKPSMRRVGKKAFASQDEVDLNPRARSAVLRVVEKRA